MKGAAATPCAQCPWRLENQGRRHPGGWYTKANLRRLWAGMRRGERMSCHPTDTANLLPPGFDPVPDHIEVRECAGALILKQREFMRFQVWAKGRANLRGWSREHPRSMTLEGLQATAAATMGLTFGLPMRRMQLADPDVGYPEALEPWTTEDSRQCQEVLG